MLDDNQENFTFLNDREYETWVKSQEWYQTIELKSGIVTKGKVRTDARIPEISQIPFSGKSVLDVGCNSGQYSLLAKKLGASKVIGLDIDPVRIHQAKVLSVNEEIPVEFRVAGIEEIRKLGKFDIVICIAVLTEIENVLGGLYLLRDATSNQAFIEMGIAKPVFYLSRNRRWWQRDRNVSRNGRVGEMQRHRHAGWVLYPTVELIKDVFGSGFEVSYRGRGLRYDVIHVIKQ